MAWVPDDLGAEYVGKAAILFSALVGIGAIDQKGYNSFMRRTRENHAGERQSKGEDTVDETWSAIVEGLRNEVERLSDIVSDISNDFRKERAARLEAEDRAVECEQRYREMESRAAGLELQVEVLKAKTV